MERIFLNRELPDTFVTKPFVRFHNRFVEQIHIETLSAFAKDVLLRIAMLFATIVVYPVLFALRNRSASTTTPPQSITQLPSTPSYPQQTAQIQNRTPPPPPPPPGTYLQLPDDASEVYEIPKEKDFPEIRICSLPSVPEEASPSGILTKENIKQEIDQEIAIWQGLKCDAGFVTFSFECNGNILRTDTVQIANKEEYEKELTLFKAKVVEHLQNYPEVMHLRMAQLVFNKSSWLYNEKSSERLMRRKGHPKQLNLFLKNNPFIQFKPQFVLVYADLRTKWPNEKCPILPTGITMVIFGEGDNLVSEIGVKEHLMDTRERILFPILTQDVDQQDQYSTRPIAHICLIPHKTDTWNLRFFHPTPLYLTDPDHDVRTDRNGLRIDEIEKILTGQGIRLDLIEQLKQKLIEFPK